MIFKDKQVNHTTENHSRNHLEVEDTHLYNNRGTYNELDEHYCLLHQQYPHCHYHQHDTNARQKTTYDNHEKHLNTNIDYTQNLQDSSERNGYQIDLNVTNHSVYSDDTNKGANKQKVSKAKTGKSKRLILSNLGENTNREENNTCAHCHSPITSAYAIQSIERNETLAVKDASPLIEPNRDLGDDEDQLGKMRYVMVKGLQ